MPDIRGGTGIAEGTILRESHFRCTAGERSMSHICLIGKKVSNDWVLIGRLKMRHVVTLVEKCSIRRLLRERILDSVRLLVLDCTNLEQEISSIIEGIGQLRSRYPELIIVLVEGPLDQAQVAVAFRQGAQDYFRSPYPPDLLVERIIALCRGR
jgi:DNA-binding NtrC family response regulator